MSAIEWTDKVWNPVTGCTKVSAGCKNCYAEGVANRFWGHQYPKVKQTFLNLPSVMRPRHFTDVQCHPERLEQPLRWRKPQRVFVNSMSDLFHEDVPDAFIDRVFAVMALARKHTFQVLTKRPERMLKYLTIRAGQHAGLRARGRAWEILGRHPKFDHGDVMSRPWPLPNVILCVSVEDQATANERIPLLLQTPAALRGVSYEPGLGPVDFDPTGCGNCETDDMISWDSVARAPYCDECDLEAGSFRGWLDPDGVDWIIVGGESGGDARPFDVAWARSTVEQCEAAGVACFVKQLGERPFSMEREAPFTYAPLVKQEAPWTAALESKKGADMSEWPEDLRVRQFPEVLV